MFHQLVSRAATTHGCHMNPWKLIPILLVV
jgi:hypothetical protein